jgi:UDP-N-acetylglucosamine enolpyruvyl transferase
VTIDGCRRARHGAEHRVILPDRIEAGTLMCAAAITNSDLQLRQLPGGLR